MVSTGLRGYYRFSCPNCGGTASDYRLIYKAPCEKCLPDNIFKKIVSSVDRSDYYQLMKAYAENVVKLKHLREIISLEDEVRKLEAFFSDATGGYRFWSAQRTWARRVLKGKSFSIIAPTGMGKTMFGLVTALYFYQRGRGKVYLVFPTTPLLNQAYEKMLKLSERAGLKPRIIVFHSRIPKKKREEFFQRLADGDFDILLTTSRFIHKYHDLLKKYTYSFIMVDDVDAILRSGKSIRLLLEIMGFSPEEIDAALQLFKLRIQAARLSDEEKGRVEREIRRLEEIVDRARKRVKTVLVVSSATGKPRGIYPRLFRILLGFEAGSRGEAVRNIVDVYVYPEKPLEEHVVELVKRLGSGGLVFVPVDKGIDYAEEIAGLLRENGVKAEAFHSKKNIRILNDFAKGNIDILVGVATYYGVMVRGLDLPERIRYALFVGVPRHKFSSKLESPRPYDVVRILSILRDAVEDDEKRIVERYIGWLTSRLRRLSPAATAMLGEELEKALRGEEYRKTPILEILLEALEYARKLLERSDVWERLRRSGDIALTEEDGRTYILIPDVATYIQASGRTSRLYPGGITRGLSVIVVDDHRLLNGLVRRMRWLFEDLEFKDLNEIDLNRLLEEIDSDRERVRKIISGEIVVDEQLEISKSALLIVESPNKARTIANFFGKPSIRVIGDNIRAYDVTTGDYVLTIIASVGHVYDLVVDAGLHNYGVHLVNGRFIPEYTDIKRCNSCGYQFTGEVDKCPKCGSRDIVRKIDVVKALRELASEVDLVFIGTDPDTEGEKIGWDLKVLLEPYTREIKRVEFHEITRRAILNAIRNPRDFDMKLIEAQIIRRVEDRWLGFALSQKLWYDLWPYYCYKYLIEKRVEEGEKPLATLKQCCEEVNRNFSAGRVQTPVLGYIIDRFERARKPDRIVVEIGDGLIRLEIPYEYLSKLGLKKAKDLLGKEVIVEEISIVEEEVNPPPPFTTDTLLAEASLRYNMSSHKTMQIAQELFELGFITYHRTDSTRVSDAGIAIARQYLQEKYGDKYAELFKPRTWGTGGAHEAIRPTRPIDPDRLWELIREGIIQPVRPLTRAHKMIYELIFRRFIASQMIPAVVRKQRLRVRIDSFETEIDRPMGIVRDGFLEIYRIISSEAPVKPGKYVITMAVARNPPLARFHDVIRWMKEQGIGRPSTYAKIVQTLLDRRYVVVTKNVKALRPTSRGMEVYRFLTTFYGDVVSVDTTRELEEKMKLVEEGREDYQSILRRIYDELQTKVINVDSSVWRKQVCG